jgi:hypothetical protein
MLQRRVRQPSYSRYLGRVLQTHLRELGAQSNHGRLARSPTRSAWRGLQAQSSEQMGLRVIHQVVADVLMIQVVQVTAHDYRRS